MDPAASRIKSTSNNNNNINLNQDSCEPNKDPKKRLFSGLDSGRAYSIESVSSGDENKYGDAQSRLAKEWGISLHDIHEIETPTDSDKEGIITSDDEDEIEASEENIQDATITPEELAEIEKAREISIVKDIDRERSSVMLSTLKYLRSNLVTLDSEIKQLKQQLDMHVESQNKIDLQSCELKLKNFLLANQAKLNEYNILRTRYAKLAYPFYQEEITKVDIASIHFEIAAQLLICEEIITNLKRGASPAAAKNSEAMCLQLDSLSLSESASSSSSNCIEHADESDEEDIDAEDIANKLESFFNLIRSYLREFERDAKQINDFEEVITFLDDKNSILLAHKKSFEDTKFKIEKLNRTLPSMGSHSIMQLDSKEEADTGFTDTGAKVNSIKKLDQLLQEIESKLNTAQVKFDSIKENLCTRFNISEEDASELPAKSSNLP